jgi:hypothetical protein
MYKLVYTSNPKMEHHLQEEFDVYINSSLLAVNKEGKGFSTSKVIDTSAMMEAGIIVKTKNSVYIFAYINNKVVSEFSGFGFLKREN